MSAINIEQKLIYVCMSIVTEKSVNHKMAFIQ